MRGSSPLERLLQCRRDPAAAAGLGTEMAPVDGAGKGAEGGIAPCRGVLGQGGSPRKHPEVKIPLVLCSSLIPQAQLGGQHLTRQKFLQFSPQTSPQHAWPWVLRVALPCATASPGTDG